MPVILGIDPGSRICGYGLINATGNRLEFVGCGCIRVADKPFPERLQIIFESLCEIIERYSPQQAAVEEVFLGRNVSSALKLGHARGAAIVACTSHDLEVSEYSARTIKKALAGTGSADKAQMQHMVVSLLALSATPQADAADALSVAICHAHTHQGLIRMAGVRHSRGGRLLGNK
jgi:crossover junction endodeoxyribonuclease RuvC